MGTRPAPLTRDQRLSYTREFSDYSMPLFVQALLSALGPFRPNAWVAPTWFDGDAHSEAYFVASSQPTVRRGRRFVFVYVRLRSVPYLRTPVPLPL